MTVVFQSVDVINAADNGVILGDGDTLFLANGVTAAGGTDGDGWVGAFSAGGKIQAHIQGTLWGEGGGINFTGSDGSNKITIGTAGSVLGDSGNGISLTGAFNSIANYGEISGGADGIDLSTNSTGDNAIANHGVIAGSTGIALSHGSNNIVNSGVIDGTLFGIQLVTPSGTTDRIDNSGTIAAGSASGTAIEDDGPGALTIVNSGHIAGNIVFDFGGGVNVYDGTLGSISGMVVANGGSNTFIGGKGAETFSLAFGTGDIAAGKGNDVMILGANLTATQVLDGGKGTDTVSVAGNYSAGLTFSPTTMVNVEKLTLGAGFNYNLTTDDATVAFGETLAVNASALGSTNKLNFNGSAESNGKFSVTGGAGVDHITGGTGADTINGGAGADVLKGGTGADHLIGGTGSNHFVYAHASESTGTGYDTVTGFDMLSDKFDLPGTVTGTDTALARGALSTATFDGDLAAAVNASHLAAQHAVEFTPKTGTLAGDHFLVIDMNGVAGYQAGADLVVLLDSAANLSHLSASDFI